uniref:UPAR/Ly6 domain-containing protein n=1 Tax=Astyanax mexicanus TaxID=7994 RepID=W5LL23_ASTMX
LSFSLFLSFSLSLSAADGLNCYTCSVGILGRCFFSSSQTCTGNNTSCFTATAAFNLSGAMNFYTSGCTLPTSCNSSSGSVLGVGYTVTQSCCTTNLCNGASSIQLPITAAIGAALLATTWSFM